MTGSAEMAGPELAVIVPHYNDVIRLERCLAALLPQVGPEVEIVVVDNGSEQDVAASVAKFPSVRLVSEVARGAGPARNRGVAETTAPGLAFLDADCVPAANWLATARTLAGMDQVTGGRVDLFDETPPPRSGAEAFEVIFAFQQQAYVEDLGFSVTANLITTRTVFEAVGPFVAGVPEDMDWCHRAAAAGYEVIYRDDLAVAHPTRGDWSALVRKWQRLVAEAFEQARTAPGGRVSWALRAVLMPASLAPHILRILFHRGLDGAEKGRAVATLVRLRLARMVWMLRQALTGRS